MNKCRAVLHMYDGEYEGECELPEGHEGRHNDGLCTWETDQYGTADLDTVRNASAPDGTDDA